MKDLPRSPTRPSVPPPTRYAVGGPETTSSLRSDWPGLLAWLPIRLLVLTGPALGREGVIMNKRSQWGTWCQTEASRSALPYGRVGSG